MSKFYGINYENKLRLRLSQHAYDTLMFDAKILNIENFGTIINKAFLGFYTEAESSVSIRLSEYESELRQALSSELEDVDKGEVARGIIEKLLSEKEKALMDALPHPKGAHVDKVIRIRRDCEYILNRDDVTCEDEYYGKDNMRAYVQALLEEFVRKPYSFRERCYFHDEVKEILSARDHKHAVSITDENFTFLYCIYDIIEDESSLSSYVIGINLSLGWEGRPGTKFKSIRLSSVKHAYEIEHMHCELNKDQIKHIEALLEEGPPSWIGSMETFANTEVEIWLSDSGIRSYNQNAYKRPKYTRIGEDGHTYYFNCLETWLFEYFFPFGSEAYLKSPRYLAKYFYENYASPAWIYSTRYGFKD